jgi:hypothetical protein
MNLTTMIERSNSNQEICHATEQNWFLDWLADIGRFDGVQPADDTFSLSTNYPYPSSGNGRSFPSFGNNSYDCIANCN